MPKYNSLIKPAADVINASRRSNYTTGVMRFPENIGAHAIVLNFKEYAYRSDVTNQLQQKGSVVLPLPQNLNESFDVRLQGTDMGLTGAIASDYWQDAMSKGLDGNRIGKSIANDLSNIFSDQSATGLLSQFAPMTGYLMRSALNAAPGLATAIDVTSGSAVNPHVAVNFDGMNLKSHSFAWQLAPSTPSESDKLRSIQSFIKKSITPSYGARVAGGGQLMQTARRAILKYPSVVDIFFLGIEQSYFYYFKRCMIQNFAMDFTPQEGHTILKGGKPAFVNMSMNLIETQIHTSEDYGATPETLAATPNPHTR